MATDPVCFAVIDEDTAQSMMTYRDREYYFCTSYCTLQLLENPEKYTRRTTGISIEPVGASC
jgi:YHS domain-containing protein